MDYITQLKNVDNTNPQMAFIGIDVPGVGSLRCNKTEDVLTLVLGSGFHAAVDPKTQRLIITSDAEYELKLGEPNGAAQLDNNAILLKKHIPASVVQLRSDGKIDINQLPDAIVHPKIAEVYSFKTIEEMLAARVSKSDICIIDADNKMFFKLNDNYPSKIEDFTVLDLGFEGVQSINGKTGKSITLAYEDIVGLLDTLKLKADLNSPVFTGTPKTSTPEGSIKEQVANVAYVDNAVKEGLGDPTFTAPLAKDIVDMSIFNNRDNPFKYSKHAQHHSKEGDDPITPEMIGAQKELGYTPLDVDTANVANGYLQLDSTGKVPNSLLNVSPDAMSRSVYDKNANGIVDQAESVEWTGVKNVPSTFNPKTHATTHGKTGLDPITPAMIGAQVELGYTPLDAAKVGVNDGVAPIGSDGKIPSKYIPTVSPIEVIAVVNESALKSQVIKQQGTIVVNSDDSHVYIRNSTAWVGSDPQTITDLSVYFLDISPDMENGIISINGKTGQNVTLNINDIPALQTALDNKIDKSNPVVGTQAASDNSDLAASTKFVKNALSAESTAIKTLFDANDDGVVDRATSADRVEWSGVQNPPSNYNPTTHASTHATGGRDALTPDQIGAIAASKIGVANGVASLDVNAKVPYTQIPDKALTKGYAANTEAEMISANYPIGTIITVGDKIYVRNTSNFGNISDYYSYTLPTSGITSVNGKSGTAITLDISDIPDLLAQLNSRAPLASPALTGNPTTTLATTVGNQIANTQYVEDRITNKMSYANPTRLVLSGTDPRVLYDAAFTTDVDVSYSTWQALPDLVTVDIMGDTSNFQVRIFKTVVGTMKTVNYAFLYDPDVTRIKAFKVRTSPMWYGSTTTKAIAYSFIQNKGFNSLEDYLAQYGTHQNIAPYVVLLDPMRINQLALTSQYTTILYYGAFDGQAGRVYYTSSISPTINISTYFSVML